MMKKHLLIFILFVLFSNSYAQTAKERLFIDIGYTYFNRSFGEIGARFDVDDKAGFFVGANVLMGSSDKKLLVIPEINATKYFNADKFPFPFARLAISPKTVTPQFGFSFLMVELGVGYGFGFNPSEQYKTSGFRASLNINIPLKFKMKLF